MYTISPFIGKSLLQHAQKSSESPTAFLLRYDVFIGSHIFLNVSGTHEDQHCAFMRF